MIEECIPTRHETVAQVKSLNFVNGSIARSSVKKLAFGEYFCPIGKFSLYLQLCKPFRYWIGFNQKLSLNLGNFFNLDFKTWINSCLVRFWLTPCLLAVDDRICFFSALSDRNNLWYFELFLRMLWLMRGFLNAYFLGWWNRRRCWLNFELQKMAQN